MKEYRLYDSMNGDLICIANNLNTVKAKARKYDILCDGDWLPGLHVSENGGAFKYVAEWSY